jgi:3-hydroxyisobutyrate dehydrogenase-like beta-hydroxyacid dehydrogenase
LSGANVNLGFLGLGHMGLPMAERLLGPGVRLHVFDPSPQAMYTLTLAGAIGHTSPHSVADSAAIVMACLPNRTVSEVVACGEDGVIHGKSVRVYVEMSTIGRECIESIGANLRAQGVGTVDAPVSGGPAAARDGTLAMMASGAPADVASVMPWLQRIGRRVYVLGERPGQAQTMKLVNNLIMATNVVVAGEGLAMGAKAGLDPDLMMSVLSASSGRSFALNDILAPSVLPGTFNFGGALAIVAKDVELGIKEAHGLNATVSVIEKSGELWRKAMDQGRAEDDFTTIVKLIEQLSGVLVRSAKPTTCS